MLTFSNRESQYTNKWNKNKHTKKTKNDIRLDMTFAVHWVLNANYLSIHTIFQKIQIAKSQKHPEQVKPQP